MARRNLILKALPILLLLVLLILSMVFCLISTTNPDWAHFDQSAGQKNGKINRTPRSPVYNCVFTDNKSIKQPNCRLPRCLPTVDGDGDYEHLCQLLDISFHLLISANVFLGLACILGLCAGLLAFIQIVVASSSASDDRASHSAAAAAAGTHSKHAYSSNHRRGGAPPNSKAALQNSAVSSLGSALNTGTLILLIAGIPCLILAHLIGTEAVLNQQQPMGDYISTNISTALQPQWMAGVANIYLFISWFSATLALVVLPLVLRLPTAWSSSACKGYESVSQIVEPDVGDGEGRASSPPP